MLLISKIAAQLTRLNDRMVVREVVLVDKASFPMNHAQRRLPTLEACWYLPMLLLTLMATT
jgi:hypothetical protein